MRFQTILIDPPWPSSEKSAYSRSNEAWPYPTLTEEQLAAISLSTLSEPGTHLWLWTTQAHLPMALRLIPLWGFKYQVCIPAIKPHGFGNWWSKTAQFLIFAYISPLSMIRKGHPTHINYTPAKHSRKPEKSYQLIESVSRSPRIELFATEQRPGWLCVGQGITGRDIVDDIAAVSNIGVNNIGTDMQ